MRNEELIEEATERDGQPLRYRVAGMDCPSCVGKIETALRRLPGIDDVSLNYHSQTLRLRLVEATTSRGKLEGTIRSLGYGLELADHVRLVTVCAGDAAPAAPAQQRWWTAPQPRPPGLQPLLAAPCTPTLRPP